MRRRKHRGTEDPPDRGRAEARWSYVEVLPGDLLHAVRRLVRAPAFSLPAVAALAIGIAAATAVYAIVYAVVLRPLPYPAARRLVRLRSEVPATGGGPWGLAKGEFLFLEQANRSFESMGLYSLWSATLQAGGDCPGAEEVLTAQVSAGLPRVLGVVPLAGRLPLAADGLPANPEVAWLGERYWSRCFGRDPAVVGRRVLLDGRPAVVAGILRSGARLPEEAKRPELKVDLWVPLHLDPAERPVASHVFRAVGRLRRGVTLAVARRDLARLTARLPEALPAAYSAAFFEKTGFATGVVPLRQDVVGEVGRLLWLLLAAAGLVLAAGAADVASLTLARFNARRMDGTLRAALGATRLRLLLFFVSEPLLIAAAATGLGLLLAGWALRLLVALAPGSLPRLQEVRLGGAAVGFAVLVALGLAVLLGALPFIFRARTACVLVPESRHCTLSKRQRRAQSVLIASQVALSLLLLAGAVLLFRSFRNLQGVSPGFAPRGVLTFRTVLPKERYASVPQAESFYRELTSRLEAMPGVGAVGSIDSLPLTGFDGCSTVYPDSDRPAAAAALAVSASDAAPCVPVYRVSPGYFTAMRIRVKGPAPSWSDVERRAPMAVVSTSLARRLWPASPAIGRSLQEKPGAAAYRIAAVADDVRSNGLDQPLAQALYLPFVPAAGTDPGAPIRQLSFAVRWQDESAPWGVGDAVRRTVAEIDPQAAVADLSTMERIVDGSLARVTLLAGLMATAAVVTLLLALIGMYGLLTYLVGRQEPEIGIRMVLGAPKGRISGQVLWESLVPATGGLLVGMGAFLGTARPLGSYLYGIGPTDWLTLTGTAGVLFVLAGFASWLPARRAARVSPLDALRQE